MKAVYFTFRTRKCEKSAKTEKTCIFFKKINGIFVKSVGIKIKDCIFVIDLF